MKEIRIRIPDVETAKQFCKAAGECSFDVDVFYNRVIIDAKSILGVLSLDLKKILTVRLYGENEKFESLCEELHQLIEQVA